MVQRRKTKARKKRSAKSKPQGLLKTAWRYSRWPLLVFTVALLLWVVVLDVQLRQKFDGRKWALPARVYAQPLELYQGQRLSPQELQQELEALGYRAVQRLSGPGQFSRIGSRFSLHSRGFHFSDNVEASTRVKLTIADNYVEQLSTLEGESAPLVRLEPVEIGGIYPAKREDRLLVRLQDIPPLLGEGLIAIEDRDFLHHWGLSPKSIARAALANLKAGGVVQGGSTLTQQLVKNFYLSHERSFTRKFKEAVLSLLLELHYSKREILETYINEVYLGQSGSREIHGFALAAQHYFNRPLPELDSSQIALLVGLVKGASYYNPWRHPERARERRNLVLKVMYDSDLITPEVYNRARNSGLKLVSEQPVVRKRYPAFLDLVKRQLLRDYQEEDLSSEGLRIFTSFSLRAQNRVQARVSLQLAELERRYKLPSNSLQAAVVSVAVGSGEVEALVGDRRAGYGGFNRALDAHRSVGSLIKPALYLTALEQGYSLASPLNDGAVTVKGPNGTLWQPKNFDRRSHGVVPLYQALAHSYNQAAARLGMQLGLSSVAESVEKLGVETSVPRLPSMLLGSVELSPLTIASIYHTIAADGFYSPLRAIRNVQTAEGKPLSRYPLAVEQRFKAEDIFQLKVAMELVMRNGSGRSAYRRLPQELAVAGKTGTSNDQRDSWFAGFSGEKLAVVWVGRDDNGETPLTGASGALPLWSSLFAENPGRGLNPTPPNGLIQSWVDIDTGLASSENCRGAIYLPFVDGRQPTEKAACSWIENPLLHWWNNL